MIHDMSEERKAAKPVQSASHTLKCCLMAAGLVAAGATVASAGTTVVTSSEVTPATSPFDGPPCDNTPAGGTIFPNSYVEPWVDVNPTNPSNIVAYTQTDRWSNGGSHGLLAGVSMDGGNTWAHVAVPGTSKCTGGTFDRASDPWLSFGPTGTLYQVSLSFDQVTPPGAPGGFGPSALLVSKSVDGGMTWGPLVTVIEDTDPRILNDKESITADPLRPNNVYVVWDRLEVPFGTVINPENVIGLGFHSPFFFSRSTDGGNTFSPPNEIFDPGANEQTIGNRLLVLPSGTLVEFFNEILNIKASDGGRGFNLALLRSTDQGTTWLPHDAPIFAAKIQSIPITTPNSGHAVRTGDILFDVAVHPINGTLYAVWQDARFSGVDAIAFSQSTDGGFTWSAPIKINQTPTTVSLARQQAFNPAVAVNDSGTVLVTYYDFRNDVPPGPAELTDYFSVFCSGNCSSPGNWLPGNEARLTTASFDITKAPIARGFFLGDYDGLVADSTGMFLSVFAKPDAPLTGSPNPAAIFFRKVDPPSTASSAVSQK